MAAALDFYFDFSSPYGYLASEAIDTIAAKHGRTVVWRPFLLGAVFKITGGQPTVNEPMKGPYARVDIARSARLLGVPFNEPDPFPVATVAACRAYYWLADQNAARAKELARALFRGFYVDNRNVGDPAVVVETATALGVDAEALGAALQDPAVKERLKGEVEAALARGVFGSPTVFIDDEMFWGADRLDQIDRWLETGGW